MSGSGRLSWWRLVAAGGVGDGQEFARKSGGFGSFVRSAGGANVVLVRGPEGAPAVYVAVPEGPAAAKTAGSLATLVSAKHAGCTDGPPELNTDGALLRLAADPSAFAARDVQQGRSPVEVAEFAQRQMPPDSWLVLSLRGADRGEVRRCRTWWRHRLGDNRTHYSNTQQPLLATFTAGGRDAAEVGAFVDALAAELPGFDLEVQARTVTGKGPLILAGLGAAIAPGAIAWLLGAGVGWALGMAAPGLLFTVLVLAGAIRSPRARLAGKLDRGGLPGVPVLPGLLVQPPRKAGVKKNSDGDLVEVKEAPGSYPLHPSAFLLDPAQAAAAACPHFGAAAGTVESRERDTPPDLLDPGIGPRIGTDADGRPVHLDEARTFEGVSITGKPNAGKTTASRILFAFQSLERVCPKGKPGWPGRSNTLIAFESKGDVRGYTDWLRVTGDEHLVVDVNDHSSVAIEVIPDGPPKVRAAAVVDMMKFIWGDTLIGTRTEEVLHPVFQLAFLLTADDARRAQVRATYWMEFAGVLLGVGTGSLDDGRALVDAAERRRSQLEREGSDPELAAELRDAIEKVGVLHGKVTPSKAAELAGPPRNKVAVLLQAGSWWDPARPRVTWQDVLDNHWCVIVNKGAVAAEEQDRAAADGIGISRVLSRLLVHTLRVEVERTCGGWQAQGRAVTIFDDELSLSVPRRGADTDEVPDWGWFKYQGRSFGVRLVLATQQMGQLDEYHREAFASAETSLWFQQPNTASVVRRAVEAITMGGADWSAADLEQLPEHHAIVKAIAKGRKQSPAAVKVDWWEGSVPDRLRMVAAQGYGDCTRHRHPWTGRIPAGGK